MTNKIKRFYSQVEIASTDTGYCIELDGRPIKSPGRRVLQVPHQKMAEQLAQEWRGQEEFVDLSAMPVMQFASVVSDNIIPAPESARAEIIKYAHSDLLCYRASGPDSLVERQVKLWDPVLEQFKNDCGIEFQTSIGIIYVEQDTTSMSRFSAMVAPLEQYQLGAIHLVTVMSGSAMLAIALQQKWMTSQEVWQLAHLDEDFQIEQWGTDDEAVERRQRRYIDFNAAVLGLES